MTSTTHTTLRGPLTTRITEHDAWGKPHTWEITWKPMRTINQSHTEFSDRDQRILWGDVDHPPMIARPAKTGGGVALVVSIETHNGLAYEPTQVGSPSEVRAAGDCHVHEIE